MALRRSLEHLRGIGEDDVTRLHSRGIRNMNQLLHATSLKLDRDRLAEKTGISAARLLELGKQAALWEVSGMERFLPVVWRLGITSQKTLKDEDAVALHGRLREAIGLAHPPSLSDVQYWISQCRMIDVIEEDGEPPANLAAPDEHTSTAEAMRLVG